MKAGTYLLIVWKRRDRFKIIKGDWVLLLAVGVREESVVTRLSAW